MTHVVAALVLGTLGIQSKPPSLGGSPAIAPQVIYWFGAGPAERKNQFKEVGVMAGFNRLAFVPGHAIIIYRRLPPSELGASRATQRFGRIEWNGVMPQTAAGQRG